MNATGVRQEPSTTPVVAPPPPPTLADRMDVDEALPSPTELKRSDSTTVNVGDKYDADTEEGEPKHKKVKKEPRPDKKKRKRIDMSVAKPHPWRQHLKEFREKHPAMKLKDAMKLAKATYKYAKQAQKEEEEKTQKVAE